MQPYWLACQDKHYDIHETIVCTRSLGIELHKYLKFGLLIVLLDQLKKLFKCLMV